MATVKRHTSWPVGATITTVMSMALVLLFVGVMCLTGIVASSVVDRVKESAGVTVSLANSVVPSQIDSLNAVVKARPDVARTRIVSRTEALQQWKDETGEDLMELLGENPLNATIEVNVKAQCASDDSLALLKQDLEQLPGVVDVSTSTRDIDNIMHNAQQFMVILAGAVLVMLVIAVALIMSVVRLLTYSQRFHIHTMTLVGARTWFIVRPYMWRGATMGLMAALVALTLVVALRIALEHSHDTLYHAVAQCLDWGSVAVVAAIMLAIGIVVGASASALAALRYTRATHDELYT